MENPLLETKKPGIWKVPILKVNVENMKGSEEKLSPEECIEGANTVMRGSVKASNGKPKATKPRG